MPFLRFTLSSLVFNRINFLFTYYSQSAESEATNEQYGKKRYENTVRAEKMPLNMMMWEMEACAGSTEEINFFDNSKWTKNVIFRGIYNSKEENKLFPAIMLLLCRSPIASV